MMRIGLLVCAVFIFIQNVNSLQDRFGSFWGPCPAAPINSTSRVWLSNLIGEWYTHRVLGQYSPWKYFQCQSNKFVGDWKSSANVSSRFDVPIVGLPIEWNGTVQDEDVSENRGKFKFHYGLGNWILLSQNFVFLQYYSRGAGLTWNCLDFIFFHIESIAVITRYQDPNDWRIDSYYFKNMNNTLMKHGISPDWFEPIQQYNCN